MTYLSKKPFSHVSSLAPKMALMTVGKLWPTLLFKIYVGRRATYLFSLKVELGMRTKVVVAAVNALGSKLDRTDDEITVIEVRRPEPPMIVSQDLYFCLF